MWWTCGVAVRTTALLPPPGERRGRGGKGSFPDIMILQEMSGDRVPATRTPAFLLCKNLQFLNFTEFTNVLHAYQYILIHNFLLLGHSRAGKAIADLVHIGCAPELLKKL